MCQCSLPWRSPLYAAEALKAAHYADTPAPLGFKPFGVGMQTELGKSATELLAMLALRIATRRNGGHLAWQVCAAFLDSPSAALKPSSATATPLGGRHLLRPGSKPQFVGLH